MGLIELIFLFLLTLVTTQYFNVTSATKLAIVIVFLVLFFLYQTLTHNVHLQ